MHTDLKQRESHFEFGKNWQSFLDTITDESIAEAVRGLQRLFPDRELQGKRFLDIGCGSGLSMLAALKLGACEVIGVDIDENSVEAARRCLSRFAQEGTWRVSCQSVFDINPDWKARFDVVHSWGVLHHTGDLWMAVDKAAALVANGGLLALALYRKTPFCSFWRWEKYVYSHMPRLVQAPVRWLYQTAFLIGKLTMKQNPFTVVRDYRKKRGMSFTHDVHDWLGGYPYESATPEQVHKKLSSLGFRIVRENIHRVSRFSGLFGSGCNEYIARRC